MRTSGLKTNLFVKSFISILLFLAFSKSGLTESIVVLETNQGNIKIALNEEKAPLASKNFLAYVDAGFYDGLIFHRVIADFMIQGGGFKPGMKQMQVKPPITNEADNGLKNTRGTLAMARTSQRDSATSQFFINLKDNAFLDHGVRGFGYAVFAEVIAGMEVVDKIAKVKTGRFNHFADVPIKDVLINKAYRLDNIDQ